ncbi:hypothetical protein NMG60_11005997 [Bertholletia excelsa]
MQREEKQRKFHEALLNMLYPSPSSPPSEQDGEEEETPNALPDSSSLDPIVIDELGECRSSSSSSDDGGEGGPQKLTRAQRKRLRKKKLKESGSSRRKIIGPLLPAAADNDCHDDPGKELQDVRQNAAEKSDSPNTKADHSKPEDSAGCTNCTNKNKLRNRRMAKKRARETSKPTTTERCHQESGPSDDS